MEKSLKSSSINHGIYLGLILSALTIFGYAISLDLFTKWWFGILFMLIIIVIGLISSRQAKKLLGGFISFKDAFTAYFIAILVGIIISAMVSILIFNIIDPEAANLLQEKIIESQVKMMENFGTPEEAVNKMVEDLRANGSMYSISNILKSIAFQLVGFSIVGLIVAAVVKKNDPDLA